MARLPYEPTIAGMQAPPPYDATDVRLFGFPLVAGLPQIRTLCRQFLNSGGDTFEPVSNTVTVEVLDYGGLRARTPPWDVYTIPQQELLLAIPVRRFRRGMFVEFGVFIPFIFVDDQSSAFTGREVLGLPKMLGQFLLDRDYPLTGPISMSLQARVAGGTSVTELIRVRSTVPFAERPENKATIIRFFGPLELFKEASDYKEIEKLSRTNEMIGFSPRILIDPGTPDRDAYRSVHRCRYVEERISVSALGPAAVILRTFKGLDIARALGLTVDQDGDRMSALSANPYRIDSNFTLGDVTTL